MYMILFPSLQLSSGRVQPSSTVQLKGAFRRWRAGLVVGGTRRMEWCRCRPMLLRCRCPVIGFDGHRGDIPPGDGDGVCVMLGFSVMAHNLLDPGANP